MPTTTFHNLPELKKNKILSIATDLFIDYKYEELNIRQMAREMEISIGSFYKYFDDKDDLYLHLLILTEKKVLEAELTKRGTILKDDNYIPISEILSEKEISLNNTWYDLPMDVMRKFYFGPYAKELNHLAFEDFLNYHKQGKLKDNLDIDFVYFIYITVMFNIQIYFRENNIKDISEKLRIKRSFYGTIFLNGILNSDDPSNLLQKDIITGNSLD